MAETVILTGYNGFLGRHVRVALEAAGWNVILAGREPPESGNHHRIDLSRPEDILALQAAFPAKAILHLAAHIGWPAKPMEELYMPNVLATGLLAGLAARNGTKFVFSSAAIVHGVRTPHISDDSPTTADTPYGRSKLLGEELVVASGAEHCILRYGGLFGAGGPSHLGLNNAISSALAGVAPVRNGQGRAKRSYLYVKDAARAALAALEPGLRGVHLAAGQRPTSIAQMLDRICASLLPDKQVTVREGAEASDQVIAHSPLLPVPRSFEDALEDIRKEHRQCG